jgi:hypothetical protein
MDRKLQEYAWAALEMYQYAMRGRPSPGWESFERELASEFATLLLFLRALPREGPRRQLLELFLDGLNLESKRGRARRARKELADYLHGKRMEELWEDELLEAWNGKVSLEKAGTDPRAHRGKKASDDVVRAIFSRRTTPESSLATVYARRHNISPGTARNALRAYMKFTGKKFDPQV